MSVRLCEDLLMRGPEITLQPNNLLALEILLSHNLFKIVLMFMTPNDIFSCGYLVSEKLMFDTIKQPKVSRCTLIIQDLQSFTDFWKTFANA